MQTTGDPPCDTCFLMALESFSRKCKKQSTIVLLTTEVEYTAINFCTKKVVGLSNFWQMWIIKDA